MGIGKEKGGEDCLPAGRYLHSFIETQYSMA